MTSFSRRSRSIGVTLVEMIVAITILAIVGAMVAVFMRRPIEGYMDASNRAELTNRADAALRRIARDVRLALPNSLRITSSGGAQYVELLLTSGGGRYRGAIDTSSPNAANVLDFSTTDTEFQVLGPMPAVAASNFIVVYNLFSAGTSSNAYAGDNRGTVSSVAGGVITLNPAIQFPFASPANRFQVVTGPVTYECNPATQQIRRFSGYGISASQPAPPGGTIALLVNGVAGCAFTYDNVLNNSNTRSGLLSMSLRLSLNGETVALQQQVHVDNSP